MTDKHETYDEICAWMKIEAQRIKDMYKEPRNFDLDPLSDDKLKDEIQRYLEDQHAHRLWFHDIWRHLEDAFISGDLQELPDENEDSDSS